MSLLLLLLLLLREENSGKSGLASMKIHELSDKTGISCVIVGSGSYVAPVLKHHVMKTYRRNGRKVLSILDLGT
jgi:hypothetical protein